jgi:hypothetical protein
MSYPSLRRRGGPTKEAQNSIRRWSERLPQKSEDLKNATSSGKEIVSEENIEETPQQST